MDFSGTFFIKIGTLKIRITCYSGELQIDDHEKTLKLLQLYFSLERELGSGN